jgi:hypothetical protein
MADAATIAQRAALAEARRHDARIDVTQTGSIWTWTADAPPRHIWSDGAVHALRIETRPTSRADVAACWADLTARMRAGLEPCACGDCED